MAEKQDCRIPLSIKVDRGESLYQNLIAPIRDDGRLTTLIVELLRAYYDDDMVRACVDRRMQKTDELKAVQDQIERMLLEHAKNIAQTQALEFEAQQLNRGVTQDKSETVSIEEDSSTKESEATLAMMNLVQNLAAKVDKISQQMQTQQAMPQQVMPMPMMYNYGGTPYMQSMPPQGYMPMQGQGYMPMQGQGMVNQGMAMEQVPYNGAVAEPKTIKSDESTKGNTVTSERTTIETVKPKSKVNAATSETTKHKSNPTMVENTVPMISDELLKKLNGANTEEPTVTVKDTVKAEPIKKAEVIKDEPVKKAEIVKNEPTEKAKEVVKTESVEKVEVIKDEPVVVKEKPVVLSDKPISMGSEAPIENPFAKRIDIPIQSSTNSDITAVNQGSADTSVVEKATPSASSTSTANAEGTTSTADEPKVETTDKPATPKKRKPASFMKTVSGLDRTT